MLLTKVSARRRFVYSSLLLLPVGVVAGSLFGVFEHDK